MLSAKLFSQNLHLPNHAISGWQRSGRLSFASFHPCRDLTYGKGETLIFMSSLQTLKPLRALILKKPSRPGSSQPDAPKSSPAGPCRPSLAAEARGAGAYAAWGRSV